MIYYVGSKVYPQFQSATIEDLLEYFKNIDEIGLDTETTGFDPYTSKILCYQFGTEERQYVVNAEEYPLLFVKKLLLDTNKTFLIHHAGFDLLFLYHARIILQNVWDTFLSEAVLHKGDKKVRKSLDVVAYRYCKVTLDKSLRGLIHSEGLSPTVIEYAANDVKYLPDIKRHQERLLKKHDLLKSAKLENEFVKALAYISYSGIYLDREEWLKKYQEDYDKLMECRSSLDAWLLNNNYTNYIDTQLSIEAFGEVRKCTINWASPLQVSKLFQEIGINVINSEGKASVDVKNLQYQKDKFDILPLYIDYKKYEKATSTYGLDVLKCINPITGRIHTTFKQIMDTGRISSGDKSKNKYSINLQNIPAEPRTRKCFKAQEGNIFIDADYSGQEQIIFANSTQDPNLIKFYKDKMGDMHSFIASKIYPELSKLPLNEIKSKYPEERQKAKSAGFAINYGGNGKTIAENLNIDIEEGNNIYHAYFKAFPQIEYYFKNKAKQAFATGYILINNIFKSKCFIFNYREFLDLQKKVNSVGFWANYRIQKQFETDYYKETLLPLVKKYFSMQGEITRMSYNYPIQGTGAEVMKLATIFFFKYLYDNRLLFKVLIPNLVHDEILVETPKEFASVLKSVIKDCMERAGDVFCKTIPLEATPIITPFWAH